MGEENVWLKEEMSRLQQALTDSEVEMVRMREENDHLQTMAALPVDSRRAGSVSEGAEPSEYGMHNNTMRSLCMIVVCSCIFQLLWRKLK